MTPDNPLGGLGVDDISSHLAVELPIEVPRDTILSKGPAVRSVGSSDIERPDMLVGLLNNLASPIQVIKSDGPQREESIYMSIRMSRLITSGNERVDHILLKEFGDCMIIHGIRSIFLVVTKHIPCFVDRQVMRIALIGRLVPIFSMPHINMYRVNLISFSAATPWLTLRRWKGVR